MRSVALSALVVLSSACSSSKGSSGGGPAGPPLYDDFSSGSVSGARWNQGQYRAELSGQAALLSQAITGALANTTYGTNLVLVGVDGGAASPFDDFNTGTTFDPARWKVGRESAQLVGGPAVQFVLDQSDAPGGAQLNLASSGLSVLQADAKVSQLSLTGQGRVGARIAGAIYNDGTNGSGTAPDVNEASSQVGDVIAGVSLTDTNASWFVIRCDTATCEPDPSSTLGLTFVKPFTSLGPVTLGTTHTLNMQWNAATHLLSFQLDGGAAVSFDPTPGYPVAGAPNRPFRQIGLRAGATGPTASFAAGSSASATAAFSNVRGQ